MRILLVEDDPQVSTLLASTLIDQMHVVDVATDGQQGWEMVQLCPYDLVILDIVLPRLNGISLCRKIREQQPDTLIMLLTARSEKADRVLGLDAGADDYIIKPFDLEELVARVRALQRRGSSSSPVLEWGRLRLDPMTRKVTFAGQAVTLRPKEYTLIELFLRTPKRIFSRREILDRLWSLDEEPPGEATIKAHIKGLRRALRDVGAENLVHTLYGQGYGLDPDEVSANDSTRSIPKVDRTTAIVAEIWQQVKGLSFERLIVLQQAIAALRVGEFSETYRLNAMRSAHQLAGALGMFGFSEGSQIAKQLEGLFEFADLTQQQEIQQTEALVYSLQQYLKMQNEAQADQKSLAADVDISDSAPPSISTQITSTQIKVLAIDDDESLLTFLPEALRPMGLEVIPLQSPTNLWQALDQIQPNLLLLDIKMPEITGLEICKAIRANEQWQWLPIIFLTVCEEFQTESFQIGADDYITKPILPSVLTTRILNRISRLQMIQQQAIAVACPPSSTELA